MTYAAFHLYFTIPQTILMLLFVRRLYPKIENKRILGIATLLSLLAVVYTTPWDNYLIYKKVWWYGSDQVLGTIGYVPIEEYFFFIIQCFFTSALFSLLLLKFPFHLAKKKKEESIGKVIVAISLCSFLYGLWCLTGEESFYLGLILSWASPIWLLQQNFGYQLLGREWKKLVVGVSIPSIYLSLCDSIAISENTWNISKQFTTGIGIGVLPLEEILFFFATNIMLVQTLILFLHPEGQEQLQEILQKFKKEESGEIA
jgi:lycopene cyclase domain-containing protein